MTRWLRHWRRRLMGELRSQQAKRQKEHLGEMRRRDPDVVAVLRDVADEVAEMAGRTTYARAEHVVEPESARDALLGSATALRLVESRIRDKAALIESKRRR